jgi:hypothetical protein
VSQTVFQSHHTDPDKWLEEFAVDYKAGIIEGGIVRLALTDGPCPYGLLGLKGLRADDMAPHDFARAQYACAAYTTTRSVPQLVALSQCLGAVWGEMAFDRSYAHGPAGDEWDATVKARLDHNEAMKRRVYRALVHVQRVLDATDGIDVRGGVLVVEDSDWQAYPGQVIAAPPSDLCRYCDEPIYFANNAWRHRATKLAALLVEEECAMCGGTGRSRQGAVLCASCFGNKYTRREDHIAEPAEAEEVVTA